MGLARAQTEFESASIQPAQAPNQQSQSGGPGTAEPGHYQFHSATLLNLVVTAYQVAFFRISSEIPLERERFDVDAKVPEGATYEQFRAMMQNLLAERFHMRVHMESRVLHVYELQVVKTGLKLNEAAADGAASLPGVFRPSDDERVDAPPGEPSIQTRVMTKRGVRMVSLIARQQPIFALIRRLRVLDHLPIVDRTGLTGKYDFVLEYRRFVPNSRSGNAPPSWGATDLFRALQKQLGLQLVSKKIPLDVVVVDSVDRAPTEP